MYVRHDSLAQIAAVQRFPNWPREEAMSETVGTRMVRPISKPSAVKVAVWILWVGLAVGLLRLPFEPPPADQSIPPWFNLAVGSLTLAVLAGIVFAIAKGRNWARVLWAILYALGLPTMYLMATELTTQIGGRPIATTVWIAQFIIQTGALVLLFRPESNHWFRSAKQVRDGA